MKSYEYNRIKYLTFDLVNAYHSVNDKATLEAVYAQVASEISQLTTEPSAMTAIQNFLSALSDTRLSTDKAERLLDELKALVEPFPMPSNAQLSKIFKKVKKLKVPDTGQLDLRNYSFFGWNDIASGRKYLVSADGAGFYGNISGNLKNVCAICKKTSQVTQFLAVTKSSSDGTYTKNGTYICLDSDQCNRQIQSADGLDNFINIIKAR